MSELPVYFDSPAQAAAMLKVDVYSLKELKAAGSKAFKPCGRIRCDELLETIEQKRAARLARNPLAAGQNRGGDPARARLHSICEVMLALAKARDLGTLSSEEYFDLGNPIVEAGRDKKLQKFWIDQMYRWLQETFSDIDDARRWVKARTKADAFASKERRKTSPWL
jgi:hypothetical protein